MTARSVFLLITLPAAPTWASRTLGAILEGGSAGLMMAYELLGKFLVRYRNKPFFTILITGTSTPPAQDSMGTSLLYRVEEELMRWWLAQENNRE